MSTPKSFSVVTWLIHLSEGLFTYIMTPSPLRRHSDVWRDSVSRCSHVGNDSVANQKVFSWVTRLSHLSEGARMCRVSQALRPLRRCSHVWHDSLREKCWGGVGGYPRSRAATSHNKPDIFPAWQRVYNTYSLSPSCHTLMERSWLTHLALSLLSWLSRYHTCDKKDLKSTSVGILDWFFGVLDPGTCQHFQVHTVIFDCY